MGITFPSFDLQVIKARSCIFFELASPNLFGNIMSRFVRQSKVRHLFGTQEKKDNSYYGLRLSTATGDGQYIKCNSKYFAVSYGTGGGGTCAVVPFVNTGAMPEGFPMIKGHKSAILDMDFHPFDNTLLATGSDDCTCKIWTLPDGGLTTDMMEPTISLNKHLRKVNFVTFHPTASHVLSTASADKSVKIWDVNTGDVKCTLENTPEILQDMKWSYDGSTLATSCKDKQLRLYDARIPDATSVVKPHDGSKCFKICWTGPDGNFVTTGFTPQSKRQFRLWDPRKLDKYTLNQDLDQASGVIMPHFDEDNRVLYLAGKGDGNIRFFELSEGKAYSLSEHRAQDSQKGICFLRKRDVDVMKCEVQRALKLTTNSVEPISFTIPRKSEHFQEDVFPDCYAGVPAMTADEYFGGKNANPPLLSLDPSSDGKVSAGRASTVARKKSYAELEKDLASALARIAELEGQLKA